MWKFLAYVGLPYVVRSFPVLSPTPHSGSCFQITKLLCMPLSVQVHISAHTCSYSPVVLVPTVACCVYRHFYWEYYY